ncbi:hypothetical protein [Membranihabitans maritimus]|uniref:hypothetical protein n=1 Tax=Membranihabitans maritimus TaxID=2904244 RepID=UPI001F3FC908|nr:hypothetical protein [Membranihabitans maritimus]
MENELVKKLTKASQENVRLRSRAKNEIDKLLFGVFGEGSSNPEYKLPHKLRSALKDVLGTKYIDINKYVLDGVAIWFSGGPSTELDIVD